MKQLIFFKNNIYISFVIDEQGRIGLAYIGKKSKKVNSDNLFCPIEVFATGENPDEHHGAKHIGSSLSASLRYVSHCEKDNEIILTLENGKLRVRQHYVFFGETAAVRSFAEIENVCAEDIGLEYVSSFCMYGFGIDKIWLCHNAWCRELEWREYAPLELGYNHINEASTKRVCISNTGTWSTKEFMPMGFIENSSESIFWQIEHNGSWNFEISDIKDENYLKLSGPSEQENGWWKNLRPGECFKTVTAAIVFADTFNEAIEEITKYRREIAYQSPVDVSLPLVFNDYMNCLKANPTTALEIPVIDAASEIGAEIYCMDAGWYADGTWWETVGEWQVCDKRFPNGIKEVFDYIRSKGMKPGIWLEPESMGIHCPILNQFSDECFFTRHGKRIIDHGRYHFDFRCPRVIDFLNGVVDRLVNELGIEYFKFDYNIDGGVGTEVNSDSFGDGLMQHQAAYLNWIDSLYERYPSLIIENCASGGMRMDYASLSHFSVQSTSDATDYETTAVISAMSGTAVIPQQAQVWVLPMRQHTASEIAFNIINAMFKRPAISAETHLLSKEQMKVLKDGIAFYKTIRAEIPYLIPFYPCGVMNFEDKVLAYGYRTQNFTYIVIGNLDHINRDFCVPLGGSKCVNAAYPFDNNIKFEIVEDSLKTSIPPKSAFVFKVQ